jgi:class 3 adenylate cyclase
MAVFGVPFGTPEDPVNSCNAALRMKDSVRILNEHRNSIGLKGIAIGIGVNTGIVRILI